MACNEVHKSSLRPRNSAKTPPNRVRVLKLLEFWRTAFAYEILKRMRESRLRGQFEYFLKQVLARR